MNTNRFPWQRWWIPRGTERLFDHHGFLDIHQMWMTKYGDKGLIKLSDLTDERCVVLLGEHGLGKTDELETLKREWANKLEIYVRLLYLRDFDNLNELRSSIKQCVDERRQSNVDRLILLLDSLDEGLLSISTLSTGIANILKEFSSEPMAVRITCRTADWPHQAEAALMNPFEKEGVTVYELLPLCQDDILVASKEWGLPSPESFLQEIINKKLAPLASKPITLHFLLRAFEGNQNLPMSVYDLFSRGCTYLCEEFNPTRKGRGLLGKLSPEQRLLVSARIAVLSQLCNRSIIIETDEMDVEDEQQLRISEILGGTERAGTELHEVIVDASAIRETLRTGLFVGYSSSCGGRRYKWAHKSYAEFLTARYLKNRNLSLAQLKSLFVYSTTDPSGIIVPQLQQVAGWMAECHEEFLEFLIQNEPQILLRSDIASMSDDVKARIVEAMFQIVRKEIIDHYYHYDDFNASMKKLNHPLLADQVERVIGDKTAKTNLRILGLKFASECKMGTVSKTVGDVALDSSNEERLREEALEVLYEIGRDEDHIRMKELLCRVISRQEEVDDNLRGLVLKILWPKYLQIEELLTSLIPVKSLNVYGLPYRTFLDHHASFYETSKDISIAIDWVLKIPNDLFDSYGPAIISIIRQSFDFLTEPSVAKRIAALFFKTFQMRGDWRNENQWNGLWNLNDDKLRHLVLSTLVEYSKTIKGVGDDLLKFAEQLLLIAEPSLFITESKDVLWIIDQIRQTSDANHAEVWSLLLALTTAKHIYHDHKEVVSASEELPSIRKALELICPEVFNREELQRNQPLFGEDWIKAVVKQTLLNLTEVKNGNWNAWNRIAHDSTFPQNEILSIAEDGLNISKRTLWSRLDEKQKSNMLDAAYSYICNAPLFPNKSIETLSYPYFLPPCLSAFILIQELQPERLEQVSSSTWSYWIPNFVRYANYLCNNIGGSEKKYSKLLLRAFLSQPHYFTSELKRYLPQAKDDAQKWNSLSIDSFRECMSPQFDDSLWSLMNDDELTQFSKDEILLFLLENGSTRALHLLMSDLSNFDIADLEARRTAIWSAWMLMRGKDNHGWDTIWPLLQRVPQFGIEVFRYCKTASPFLLSSLVRNLSENQLDDLLSFILKHFTSSIYIYDDMNKMMSAEYNPDDEIYSNMLDDIVEELSKKGSFQSLNSIKRLSIDKQHFRRLNRFLLDAETLVRRNSWTPPTPRMVLSLLSDTRYRLVTDANQLMEVIIESLDRLEVELHGVWRPVLGLWNERKSNESGHGHKHRTYSPKDEESLSNRVAEHLHRELIQQGILLTREPEIAPTIANIQGQRIDILVTMNVSLGRSAPAVPISVVVEVKGQWNKSLLTSMKTQLVDRYLRENNLSRHGIYVVGYYYCDQWCNEPRKYQAKKVGDKNKLRATLVNEADQLSRDDIYVRSYVIDVSLEPED